MEAAMVEVMEAAMVVMEAAMEVMEAAMEVMVDMGAAMVMGDRGTEILLTQFRPTHLLNTKYYYWKHTPLNFSSKDSRVCFIRACV